MSSSQALQEFQLKIVRLFTDWLPENTVIWDHQPNTGDGGTSNVNTKTWLALQTMPARNNRLGYYSIENGSRVYAGSFRVQMVLRFYGPDSLNLLMSLRDKIKLNKSEFSPLAYLFESNTIDATAFLSARWERRVATSLSFDVGYKIVSNTTIKLVDKIKIAGRLIEIDSSELEKTVQEFTT